MNLNNLVKYENVGIGYGKHKVLKDVSFEINDGDLVFIFGANGSGKSTLIKSLLGLVNYSGNISISGQSINQKIISESLGYSPQYSSIDRDFPITVQELIDLECKLSPQCSISTKEHLELLNASHLLNKKISDLSGGEFQKVLIIRALASDPKILILDEPINNLDENSQRNLIDFVYELNKDHGKTIIVISHDFNIIRHNVHNKVLYLNNGKVSEETEESLLHSSDYITQHFHTES